MHGNLKISIVTVSFNAAATIEETIKSVVDQIYDNIEYIIIDGGSTDGTVDIIRRYAHGGSEYGKHVNAVTHWISEPDKGIYDAMNKGIAAATGGYIYFLGADDLLIDNSVIMSVEDYINDIQSIYYGDVILQPLGKKYCGKFSKWDLIRRDICHQAIFYPADILKQYPYDLKYRTYSDYYENILLWGKNIKFSYIPVTICNFLVGGSSISGDPAFFSSRAKIIKDNLGITGYLYYCLRVKTADIIRRR